jgi:hypothetical protein
VGGFDFDFASNISTAGDVEHCTKLEATLVESFPLIFMHLVSLLDCPQTSRTVLQLWLLLCFFAVFTIRKYWNISNYY